MHIIAECNRAERSPEDRFVLFMQMAAKSWLVEKFNPTYKRITIIPAQYSVERLATV